MPGKGVNALFGLVVNETDEIEVVRHARELAAIVPQCEIESRGRTWTQFWNRHNQQRILSGRRTGIRSGSRQPLLLALGLEDFSVSAPLIPGSSAPSRAGAWRKPTMWPSWRWPWTRASPRGAFSSEVAGQFEFPADTTAATCPARAAGAPPPPCSGP